MKFPIKAVLAVLLTTVVVMIVLHWVFYDSDFMFRDRFDLNREANFPSWLSSVIMFSVSVLAALIHLRHRALTKTNLIENWYWFALSLAFLWFSMDEVARIHEMLGQKEKYRWLGYYAPIAAVFLLINVKYFLFSGKKPGFTGQMILGGLGIFVIGSMVAEFLFHHFRPMPLVLTNIQYTIEEGLEFVGVIMVLAGCMHEHNKLISKY